MNKLKKLMIQPSIIDRFCVQEERKAERQRRVKLSVKTTRRNMNAFDVSVWDE